MRSNNKDWPASDPKPMKTRRGDGGHTIRKRKFRPRPERRQIQFPRQHSHDRPTQAIRCQDPCRVQAPKPAPALAFLGGARRLPGGCRFANFSQFLSWAQPPREALPGKRRRPLDVSFGIGNQTAPPRNLKWRTGGSSLFYSIGLA